MDQHDRPTEAQRAKGPNLLLAALLTVLAFFGLPILWYAIASSSYFAVSNTQVAPGFKIQSYLKVAPGMSEATVLRLLGPPLKTSVPSWGGGEKTYHYSDRKGEFPIYKYAVINVKFKNGVVEYTRSWLSGESDVYVYNGVVHIDRILALDR